MVVESDPLYFYSFIPAFTGERGHLASNSLPSPQNRKAGYVTSTVWPLARGLLALLAWFVLSAVFCEPGLHWSKNNQPTQRLCLDLPSCSHTFLLQATCVSCSTLGRSYSLFFQGMCLHKDLALTNELFIPRPVISCRLHCSAALFGRPKVPLVSPVPLCHVWDPGENSPIPGAGSLQAQLNKVLFCLPVKPLTHWLSPLCCSQHHQNDTKVVC